jgi:hypothetical protein
LILETYASPDYRLSIYQDDCAENPRSWDTFGRMACWHSRYDLGDKNDYGTPRDFLADLAIAAGMSAEMADEASKSELLDRINQSQIILIPLHLYDHGGITISASPFSCPWDSGQVGWMYATPEQIRAEFGRRITKRVIEKAQKLMLSELEVYDQYLSGDVYGFSLEKKQSCGHFEEVDSCWGFYGADPRTNGMADHMDQGVLSALSIT